MRQCILLLLLLPLISTAQKPGKSVFKAICNYLNKEDKYYHIGQNIHGVTILVNPVTTTSQLAYADSCNKKTIRTLKKYTHNQQLIIAGKYFPAIIPLQDTICIIDTSGFFTGKMQYKHLHHFYYLTNKNNTSNPKTTYVYVYAMQVTQKQIITALSYSHSNETLSLYFDKKKHDVVRISHSQLTHYYQE